MLGRRGSTEVQTSGGIGFFGLLGILFIALKLLGKIDWPWVWVLAPIWIPFAIVLLIGVIVLAIGIVKILINRRK